MEGAARPGTPVGYVDQALAKVERSGARLVGPARCLRCGSTYVLQALALGVGLLDCYAGCKQTGTVEMVAAPLAGFSPLAPPPPPHTPEASA